LPEFRSCNKQQSPLTQRGAKPGTIDEVVIFESQKKHRSSNDSLVLQDIYAQVGGFIVNGGIKIS
jgi:hypothetical protein